MPQMPHMVEFRRARLSLLAGEEKVGQRSLRLVPAAVSQHLLVDLNNSLGNCGSRQMLHLLPSVGPVRMTQDAGEIPREILNLRFRDRTPRGSADDFPHIAHIG